MDVNAALFVKALESIVCRLVGKRMLPSFVRFVNTFVLMVLTCVFVISIVYDTA